MKLIIEDNLFVEQEQSIVEIPPLFQVYLERLSCLFQCRGMLLSPDTCQRVALRYMSKCVYFLPHFLEGATPPDSRMLRALSPISGRICSIFKDSDLASPGMVLVCVRMWKS